jgi:hypothetical protein
MTKKRILGCLRVPPVEYHCSGICYTMHTFPLSYVISLIRIVLVQELVCA